MSWQMKAVGLYLGATRKRHYTDPHGGERMLAEPKGPIEPPPAATRGLTVTQHDIAGYPVHAVARPGADRQNIPSVVYCHGGSFVHRIAVQHWRLVARIARELDVTVLVPHYGLAPEHDAQQARELLAALLDRAESDGRSAYLAGDSAGGNLALVAAQQAVARGLTCLAGVTLIAPWLDLSISNPEIPIVEQRDPWLASAALPAIARAWANGTGLQDPLVSPLFGAFEGLPPVDLWIGDRDICLPDAQLLRDAIAAVGTVTYHEEPGALHVHPILPTPEGRRAQRELVAQIGRVLG